MSTTPNSLTRSSTSSTPRPLPLPLPLPLPSHSHSLVPIPTRPPRKFRFLDTNTSTNQVQQVNSSSVQVQGQPQCRSQLLSQYQYYDAHPSLGPRKSIIPIQNSDQNQNVCPGQIRMSVLVGGKGDVIEEGGQGKQCRGNGVERGGQEGQLEGVKGVVRVGGQRKGVDLVDSRRTGGGQEIREGRQGERERQGQVIVIGGIDIQHRYHRRTKSSTNVKADLAFKINDLNNLNLQNVTELDFNSGIVGDRNNGNGYRDWGGRGENTDMRELNLNLNLYRERKGEDGSSVEHKVKLSDNAGGGGGGNNNEGKSRLLVKTKRGSSRSISRERGKENDGERNMEIQRSISRSVNFKERELNEGSDISHSTRLRPRPINTSILGMTLTPSTIPLPLSPSPSLSPSLTPNISTTNPSRSPSPMNSPTPTPNSNHPNSYYHYHYNTTSTSNSSPNSRSPNPNSSLNQAFIIPFQQRRRSSSPFSTSLNKTYPYHGYPRDKAPAPEPEPERELQLELIQADTTSSGSDPGYGQHSTPFGGNGGGTDVSTSIGLLPHFEFQILARSLRSRSRSMIGSRNRSGGGTTSGVERTDQEVPVMVMVNSNGNSSPSNDNNVTTITSQPQPNESESEREKEKEKSDSKGNSKAKYGLGFGVGFGTGFTSAMRGIHNMNMNMNHTTTIRNSNSSSMSISMISTCSTWSAISLSEINVGNSEGEVGIKNETEIDTGEESTKPQTARSRHAYRLKSLSSKSSPIPGGGYTKLEVVRTNGSGNSERTQTSSLREIGSSMRHNNGTTLFEKTKSRLGIGLSLGQQKSSIIRRASGRSNVSTSMLGSGDSNNGNSKGLFGLMGRKCQGGRGELGSGLGGYGYVMNRGDVNASNGKRHDNDHVGERIEGTSGVGDVERASDGSKEAKTVESEFQELDLHLNFNILNRRSRRDGFVLDDSTLNPSYFTRSPARSCSRDNETLVGENVNLNLNSKFDDTWLDPFKLSFDTDPSSASRNIMSEENAMEREDDDRDNKMIPRSPLVKNQFEGLLGPRAPMLMLLDFPNLESELSGEAKADVKSERRNHTSMHGGAESDVNTSLVAPRWTIRRTNSAANWCKALPNFEDRSAGKNKTEEEGKPRGINLNLDLDLGFDFGKEVLAMATGDVDLIYNL